MLDAEAEWGCGASCVFGRSGCIFESKGVAKLLGMSLRANWARPHLERRTLYSVTDMPRIMFACSSLFLRAEATIDSMQIYPWTGEPPFQCRMHYRRVIAPDGTSFHLQHGVPHLGIAAVVAFRKQAAAPRRDGAL